MGSVKNMSMDETIRFVEGAVVIGVLIYVGAVCLDKLSAAGLINATGPFNGTVAQVSSMWTSSTGMVSTVLIIAAAAIIIRMVMSFRKSSN